MGKVNPGEKWTHINMQFWLNTTANSNAFQAQKSLSDDNNLSIQQQRLIAHCSHQASLTNIFREEHDKEWSDQVINPLHVAAGWVTDGPDKQDSFKDLEEEGKPGA